MASLNGIYWGIAAFFAVKFFAVGIYLPFFPLILAARGLSAGEIATILAAAPVIRIVTAPLLGTLADRFENRRSAAFVYALAAAVLIVPILWVQSFPAVFAVVAVFSVFWPAVLPVADALAVVAAERRELQYGRMRLWGSVAFIAANLLAGRLLDLSGPDLLMSMILAGSAAIVLTAMLLPRDEARPGGRPPAPLWSLPALRVLLADPPAALLLAGAALGQGAHAMVYAFGTIHWRSLGLAGAEIGAAWGIGVVAEVALFAYAGRIAGPRAAERLVLAGALAGLVRWILMPFAGTAVAILGLQVLHGVSFGATHLGAMRVVAERLPHAHAGGALGLYTAATGLTMSAASALSGPTYAAFGGFAFWAMAALCGMAAGCVLAPQLARRRHDG